MLAEASCACAVASWAAAADPSSTASALPSLNWSLALSICCLASSSWVVASSISWARRATQCSLLMASSRSATVSTAVWYSSL